MRALASKLADPKIGQPVLATAIAVPFQPRPDDVHLLSSVGASMELLLVSLNYSAELVALEVKLHPFEKFAVKKIYVSKVVKFKFTNEKLLILFKKLLHAQFY